MGLIEIVKKRLEAKGWDFASDYWDDDELNSLREVILETEAALRQPPVIGISFDLDKFANALKDEFGESLVEEDGCEEDAYNWWLTDVTVTDIVEFLKNYR